MRALHYARHYAGAFALPGPLHHLVVHAIEDLSQATMPVFPVAFAVAFAGSLHHAVAFAGALAALDQLVPLPVRVMVNGRVFYIWDILGYVSTSF